MQRPFALTFATFVAVPENRPALLAVQQVAADLCSGQPTRAVNPLYLHGNPGTGKSHLAAALADEVTRQRPELVVTVLLAGDLDAFTLGGEEPDGEEATLRDLRQSDLLIVEDLQHLNARRARVLARLVDDLLPRQVQLVCTASVGPKQLTVPARLANRLAGGLVVGLEPLQAASRLELLQDRVRRRQLSVRPDVLAWLAEHLAAGRQLDGALNRLEVLSQGRREPLDAAAVARLFAEQAAADRPTVERVARQVGSHFQVELRRLRSEDRARHVLLPRQVGMYLARELTGLSLGQIGAYFGGRDHSTVSHACRKVEEALTRDATLSGTVRQLYQDLA